MPPKTVIDSIIGGLEEEKPRKRTGRNVRRDAYGGFKVVDPTTEELDFFKEKPDVAGMATGDGHVVLNPYSKLPKQNQEAVILNESVRLAIKKHKIKAPKITGDQRKRFAGYGSDDDIAETIIARLVSGDASAGKATPEQIQLAMDLRKRLIGE